MFICELLNFRGVEIINCWNIVAQNWGTAFHFSCVQPALVEFEVLFCKLCTLHRDCVGIARQAFQYSGSVSYLFPLTVAAVLEGGAVCISDRSRLLTSNLTVHARIKYLCWQVFSLRLCHWKGTLYVKFIHLLLGCRRAKLYGKSTVINSGILYNYFRHRLAQVALG